MRKRIVGIVAAVAFLVLGTIALGIGRQPVASAHTQTPVVQTQVKRVQAAPLSNTQETPEATETPESTQDSGQDKNLPNGGHQDQGQADHQFDGIE